MSLRRPQKKCLLCQICSVGFGLCKAQCKAVERHVLPIDQLLKIDRIHIKTQAIITAVRGASTNRIPNVNALFPKQIYQLFVTALGKTLRGHLNVILARLDAEPVHQSVH